MFSIANLSMGATYALLGRWLALALVVLATIRTIIYYIYARSNLKPNIYVMVAFEVLFVIVSILMWNNYLDLLMLINLCMLTYTTWQDNMKVLRIGYCVSAILLIVYNLLVHAYVGSISEIIMLIFSIIAIYKFDIKGQIKDIVEYFYKTIAPTYKMKITSNEDYTLVISESVKDSFNNFVYIKNALQSEQQTESVKQIMAQNQRKPAIYLKSKDGEYLPEIMEFARKHKLLFHDTWMKLRSAHVIKKRPCQIEIECKIVDESSAQDIMQVFSSGFVHQSGDAIYKFSEDYEEKYNALFKDSALKKYNITPYMAFYNNQPIALLFVYKNGTNAFLCQITTIEQYRRKGVASNLIRFAVERERKQGVGEFYLVTEKYTYLESFYMKNNFEEIAQGICVQVEE